MARNFPISGSRSSSTRSWFARRLNASPSRNSRRAPISSRNSLCDHQAKTADRRRQANADHKETKMTDSMIATAKPHGMLTPRQVAEAWFADVEQNRLSAAQALLDENVVW